MILRIFRSYLLHSTTIGTNYITRIMYLYFLKKFYLQLLFSFREEFNETQYTYLGVHIKCLIFLSCL